MITIKVLALDRTIEQSDGSEEEEHSHPPPENQEDLKKKYRVKKLQILFI